jgi:hypothetical protein
MKALKEYRQMKHLAEQQQALRASKVQLTSMLLLIGLVIPATLYA